MLATSSYLLDIQIIPHIMLYILAVTRWIFSSTVGNKAAEGADQDKGHEHSTT